MKSQNVKSAAPKVASFYKIFTFADKILIFMLILFSIFSFFLTKSFINHPSYILVELNGNLIGQFKLSENRIVEVNGKIGKTIIKIEDNEAKIIDAPCPDKLCMHKRIGDIIVCIPNGVIIKFKNNQKQNKYDTITN
jgi:hypothetical protein